MPVVGTAGHVDHGKTALILALTGIDTDRLPEEKSRGMTTDLGYAHFEAPNIGKVGVVDVPGHERFIRNMVAGASSIDGAILVVAADDGWMEQTERHLRVLKAFEVPVLAVAVTKADLVPASRAEEVGAEALRRVAAAFPGSGGAWGFAPAAVAVDSTRGRGISILRESITAALALLIRPPVSSGCVGLNVDRVFTLRGPGLVVAGTLRGGKLSRGSELLLLPAEKIVRVRGIQCYGIEAEYAPEGSRVALAISRAKSDPRRGDRLVGVGSPSMPMRSFYAAIEESSSKFKIRPGFQLELAVGTAHRAARVWPSRTDGFLRATVEEPFAASPGEPIIFLRIGGADVLASGRILASGGENADRRREMERAVGELGREAGGKVNDDVSERFRIALDGFCPLYPGRAAPSGVETAGAFAFSRAKWMEASEALQAASSEPGGLSETSLPGRLGLPSQPAKAIATRLEAEGKIQRKNGSIVRAEQGREVRLELPPSARALLLAIEKAGTRGFERPEPAQAGFGKDFDLLNRAGLVVALDAKLSLSRRAYGELVDRLISDRIPGSFFSVPEAKAATNLSRKWVLPFLNRMERDGWVKREGEHRKVLRSAHS